MPVDIEARVIRNTRLSSDYHVIALAAPEIAAAAAPGQFVMIKPGRTTDPLLRRPFSVFEVLRPHGRVEGLTLLSKRIGVTTRMLFDAREGDLVSCLGPLGHPFSSVEPPREAWIVAGGVGLAPFAMLSGALLELGTPTTLFYGARTADELFYLDSFRSRGVRLVLTTEDGSTGLRGRVTAALEQALSRAAAIEMMVYACGPEPMLEAVSQLTRRFGRSSQVSVERVMGCGMGGCYSCVIPVRDRTGAERHYVRSCLSGPVFDGSDLVWEA